MAGGEDGEKGRGELQKRSQGGKANKDDIGDEDPDYVDVNNYSDISRKIRAHRIAEGKARQQLFSVGGESVSG